MIRMKQEGNRVMNGAGATVDGGGEESRSRKAALWRGHVNRDLSKEIEGATDTW